MFLRGAGFMRAFHFLKPSYVPEEVFEDYSQHNWKSLEATFDRVLLDVPGGALIRQIQSVPILNLVGEQDDKISRRTVHQANVENAVMPGGHLMLLEHPVEVAQKIEGFLRNAL
jgi:pimeloyl-ACP methyl ester carboxylesterase